jgi:DNA-directed RNA polymerase specialized sigma24 family protein
MNSVDHPLLDATLFKILVKILVGGGVPRSEGRDYVQTVYAKALAAAPPPETPEGWGALARRIAEGEVIDYRRKRNTARKYDEGLTERADEMGPAPGGTPSVAAELKQEAGCLRQVLDEDGVHPHAHEIAAGQAAGETHAEIGARLGLSAKTVANVVSLIRDAFARRWDREKITWGLAWLVMIVIGLPALVSHLHPKHDEAKDLVVVPSASTSTPAPSAVPSESAEAEAKRRDALQLCEAGEYLDCLIGLNEAKKLDPEGDRSPEVQEARRNANARLDELEAHPAPTNKLGNWPAPK